MRRIRGVGIRMLGSAAILLFLVRSIDVPAALAQLQGVDGTLLTLSVAIYLGGQVVSALRLTVLARTFGFAVAPRHALAIQAAGVFFGLAIPTTIGTDATRAILLGREPPGPTRAILAVLSDRLLGVAALVVTATLAVPFGPLGRPSVHALAIATAGLSLVAGAGWLAVRAARRLRREHPCQRLLNDGEAWSRTRRPRVMAELIATSLAIVALQVTCQLLLARSIGLRVSMAFAASYHTLVVVAGGLPLAVAGFGTREAAYVAAMRLLGVPPEQGIALSLLWFFVGLLNGAVGGVVFAVSGIRRTPPVQARMPSVPSVETRVYAVPVGH